MSKCFSAEFLPALDFEPWRHELVQRCLKTCHLCLFYLLIHFRISIITVTSNNHPFLFSSETWDAALNSLSLSVFCDCNNFGVSLSDCFKCFLTADVFAALVRVSIWSRNVIVRYKLFGLFAYSAKHRKSFFVLFSSEQFRFPNIRCIPSKSVFVEICIYFCLYMLSIIVLKKKIKIGKNQYRQVTLPKKSEIWIGQENCNRCISTKCTHALSNRIICCNIGFVQRIKESNAYWTESVVLNGSTRIRVSLHPYYLQKVNVITHVFYLLLCGKSSPSVVLHIHRLLFHFQTTISSQIIPFVCLSSRAKCGWLESWHQYVEATLLLLPTPWQSEESDVTVTNLGRWH